MTNGEKIKEIFGIKDEHMNDLGVETTQMIDKSNFSQEQYKSDLQSAYDCGYAQAKNDLGIDCAGRQETLDWLYRLRSEIYVYMPREWLIPMNNALDAAIKTLEQEPCEDWRDVPSDEMTLEQARQAVKDLRKKLVEHLEQKPKIKVLDHDEAIRRLGTVDIYKASAWTTLFKDLEYLGLKICEVKE